MSKLTKPVFFVVAGPNGSGKTSTIYDNSIEDHLPRLLYRTVDGKVFKQYIDDVPEWAKQLVL